MLQIGLRLPLSPFSLALPHWASLQSSIDRGKPESDGLPSRDSVRSRDYWLLSKRLADYSAYYKCVRHDVVVTRWIRMLVCDFKHERFASKHIPIWRKYILIFASFRLQSNSRRFENNWTILLENATGNTVGQIHILVVRWHIDMHEVTFTWKLMKHT